MKRWLYPKDWNKIAAAVKARAGMKCQECGRAHNPTANYTLTVHHIDGDPANNRESNLIALCQRCHLPKHAGGIGAVPGQLSLFPHEETPAAPGLRYRVCQRSLTMMISYAECELRREEKVNNPKDPGCSTGCHEYRKHEREKVNA